MYIFTIKCVLQHNDSIERMCCPQQLGKLFSPNFKVTKLFHQYCDDSSICSEIHTRDESLQFCPCCEDEIF